MARVLTLAPALLRAARKARAAVAARLRASRSLAGGGLAPRADGAPAGPSLAGDVARAPVSASEAAALVAAGDVAGIFHHGSPTQPARPVLGMDGVERAVARRALGREVVRQLQARLRAGR